MRAGFDVARPGVFHGTIVMLRTTCGLAVALGVLCGSCSSSTPEPIDDAYAGDPPFPDLRPQLALPRGDFGLVSNNGSDTVTLLDLEQWQVVGSAPVGRDPVAIDGPHHIAVDRRAKRAFTALAYPVPAASPGPHAAHGPGPAGNEQVSWRVR